MKKSGFIPRHRVRSKRLRDSLHERRARRWARLMLDVPEPEVSDSFDIVEALRRLARKREKEERQEP